MITSLPRRRTPRIPPTPTRRRHPFPAQRPAGGFIRNTTQIQLGETAVGECENDIGVVVQHTGRPGQLGGRGGGSGLGGPGFG